MAKTARLELDFNLEGRYYYNQLQGTAPTASIYNAVVDIYGSDEGRRTYVRKRPGLRFSQSGLSGTEIRGWIMTSTGSSWRCIDNKLYFNTTLVVAALVGSTGMCGFCRINDLGGVERYFFCDGQDGYVLTPGVATKVTDVDFPRPHIPMPIFMDGYLFIQTLNSGRIFNSALNDVTSWATLDSIGADAFPDRPVALVRVKNSIVALGASSTEFFFNAGNAKGSPLSPMQAQQLQIGCADARTVTLLDDSIYFVARNTSGHSFVAKIEGFNMSKVSNQEVDNLLNIDTTTPLLDATAFKLDGHGLVMVNIINTSVSVVLDVSNGLTYIWSGTDLLLFRGRFANTNEFERNRIYMLDRFDARIWYLDDSMYLDNNADTIRMFIRTLRFDGGTMKRKFARSLEVLFESYPEAVVGSGNANITISHTDDDFDTMSSPITFDLKTRRRAYIKSGGSFRRRAYVIQAYNESPTVIQGIELEYDEGTN